MLTLDQANAMTHGYLPGLFGIEFTHLAPGEMGGKLTIRQEMMAPNGYLHAATIIALADTVCGVAVIGNLPEGASGFTTIELKSNFLGTAREGVLTCEGRMVHGGRTTQVWDASVVSEVSGKTIALFRCTQMILYPRG